MGSSWRPVARGPTVAAQLPRRSVDAGTGRGGYFMSRPQGRGENPQAAPPAARLLTAPHPDTGEAFQLAAPVRCDYEVLRDPAFGRSVAEHPKPRLGL
jgi:hypothetical protein